MSQIIIKKLKDYDNVFNTNTFERTRPEPLNWLEINDRQNKKKDGVDGK